MITMSINKDADNKWLLQPLWRFNGITVQTKTQMLKLKYNLIIYAVVYAIMKTIYDL